MVKVVFEGNPYQVSEEETLLNGLLDQGAEVPFGCKTGSCQSCLLKCSEGEIPPEAQKGLRETQRILRFLLACQCLPVEGMRLALPDSQGGGIKAKIEDLRHLNAEIVEVTINPASELIYKAGQFIRLYNPEGISRPYSLASVIEIDKAIKLHIREYPQGSVSHWVHHKLSIGDEITISEAMGECFYLPGMPDQPLLMIGTGSGLAPLFGILREALHLGHKGPIHFFHGARTIQGLYCVDELNALMREHPQLHYQPCVSDPDTLLPPHILSGRASDIAFGMHPKLKDWRVFLCGNPSMVRAAQVQAFLADAALHEIHADPFDHQLST